MFRISKKDEIFHIFCQKLRNLTEILLLESIEFLVMTVLSVILVVVEAVVNNLVYGVLQIRRTIKYILERTTL